MPPLAASGVMRCLSRDSVDFAGLGLGSSRRFIADCFEVKLNLAANDFFEGDSGRLVFSRVDIDPWPRAALQLLAAFGRQDYQAVL